MSTYVVDWVLTEAPTANVLEFAILSVMAARADRDGCGVFPAVPKIAKACHVDAKTVRNHLGNMVERGILAPGDPTSPGALKHAKIRADNRPNLYDILVPVDWYSAKMLADINDEREMMRRVALTSENRPPLGPAPAKKVRSDKGKARPERRKKAAAEKTPLSPAETGTGGISVPPFDGPEPAPESGSEPGSRGEYQSGRGGTDIPVAGGLSVPQTCKGNLSGESVNAGRQCAAPPHPQRTQTAGGVENGVTTRLGFSTELPTACAETGAAAEVDAGEDGNGGAGEVGESVRESVMAQVRAKHPSKVRSRVTPTPSQRRSQRPESVSATTPPAA